MKTRGLAALKSACTLLVLPATSVTLADTRSSSTGLVNTTVTGPAGSSSPSTGVPPRARPATDTLAGWEAVRFSRPFAAGSTLAAGGGARTLAETGGVGAGAGALGALDATGNGAEGRGATGVGLAAGTTGTGSGPRRTVSTPAMTTPASPTAAMRQNCVARAESLRCRWLAVVGEVSSDSTLVLRGGGVLGKRRVHSTISSRAAKVRVASTPGASPDAALGVRGPTGVRAAPSRAGVLARKG